MKVERKISLFFSLSICGNPDPKFLSVSVALPCSPWLGSPLHKVQHFPNSKVSTSTEINLISENWKHSCFLLHKLKQQLFYSNVIGLCPPCKMTFSLVVLFFIKLCSSWLNLFRLTRSQLWCWWASTGCDIIDWSRFSRSNVVIRNQRLVLDRDAMILGTSITI